MLIDRLSEEDLARFRASYIETRAAEVASHLDHERAVEIMERDLQMIVDIFERYDIDSDCDVVISPITGEIFQGE